MNQNKHILSAFIFLFLSLFSLLGKADVNISSGAAEIFNNNEKEARNRAIDNALIDAVKKETALLLNTAAIIRHRAVIQEQIHNKARNFIKAYEIVKDELEDKIARVQIKVDVASDAVKQKLTQLYIFQSKINYKRLMVVYNSRHSQAPLAKNMAVYSALNAVSLEFKQSLFLVASHDPSNIRGISTAEGKTVEKCLKYLYDASHPENKKKSCDNIKNKRRLDALVEFEVIADKEESFPDSMFSYATVAVRMRAYDLSSLRLISNVESSQRQLTDASEGNADWSNAVSRTAEKSAGIAAVDTLSNMLEHYKNTGDINNIFLIIFKEISANKREIVTSLLENVEGCQSMFMLPSDDFSYFKIQYASNLDKQRLAMKILLKFKKRRLTLKYRALSGNRLLFMDI